MNILLSKFEMIKYHPTNLENCVEKILKEQGVEYLHHPFGKQKSPDFHLVVDGKRWSLECKSSKSGKPMWNGHIPSKDVIYIFTTPNIPTCIFTGDVLVTNEIQDIFLEYKMEHKALQHKINKKLQDIDNPANMQVFARNMFVQKNKISDIAMEISVKSEEYVETKTKAQLYEFGQFFTTNSVLLESLFKELPNDINKILEPSCGFGNVIEKCISIYPEANITGVEISKEISLISKKIFKDYEAVSINTSDFLTSEFRENNYDLVIGNPPYFHINTSQIPGYFNEITRYRTNIFSLFIYKSIKLLKAGGYLRFIVPKSICTGKYFTQIRNYIHKTCNIFGIEYFKGNLFKCVQQPVVVLKLIKKSQESQLPNQNGKYITIINNDAFFFNTEYNSNTTIKSLGCSVKGGNIIWNSVREMLSNVKTPQNIPIVMTRNICDQKLIWSGHKTKKQYLSVEKYKHKIVSGPIILVSRVVGSPVKLKIHYYNQDEPIFVENHVNIISGNVDKLNIIYNSLLLDKTSCFLDDFLSNSQLSKTELQDIVPIFT